MKRTRIRLEILIWVRRRKNIGKDKGEKMLLRTKMKSGL